MCPKQLWFALIVTLTLMVLSPSCSDDPVSDSMDVGLDLDASGLDGSDLDRSDGLLDVVFDRPEDGQTDAIDSRTISLSGTFYLEEAIAPTDDGAYVLVLLPDDAEPDGLDLWRDALAAAVVPTGAGYVGGHISIRSGDGNLRNVSYSQARQELVIESTRYSATVGEYRLKIGFFLHYDENGLADDPTCHVPELFEVEVTSLPARIEIGTKALSEVAPPRSVALLGTLSLSGTVGVSSYGAAYAIYLLPESYDTAQLGTVVPEETLAILWVPVETGYTGGSVAVDGLARTVNPSNPRLWGEPWNGGEMGVYHLGFHFFQFNYSGTTATFYQVQDDVEITALPASIDLRAVTLVPINP